MAWVTQRTWVTAETVTASQLNVMLRDDLRFLYSRPYASAMHNQSQDSPGGILTSGIVDLDFDTTDEDTDGMRDVTSADYPASVSLEVPSTRFIKVNTAGKILFTACVGFPEAATYHCDLSIARASDSVNIAHVTGSDAATLLLPAKTVSTLWDCAIGDLFYVRVPWSHSPGGNPLFSFPYSASLYPRFSAQWMGN